MNAERLKIATTALSKITTVPRAEFDMTTVATIAQTALCDIDAIAPPVAAGSVDMEEVMAVAKEIVNFEDRLIVMRRRAEKAEAELSSAKRQVLELQRTYAERGLQIERLETALTRIGPFNLTVD